MFTASYNSFHLASGTNTRGGARVAFDLAISVFATAVTGAAIIASQSLAKLDNWSITP